MLKTFLFLLALTTAACAQDLARNEALIWNLEKAYWEYVKATTCRTIVRSGMMTSSAGHSLVRRPFEKITSPIGSRTTHRKA